MTGWKCIDQLNITCASALDARDSNSSKLLSDNNSNWHWAGGQMDGFFADTTKAVNHKTRGPYGTDTKDLPEFSQRHSS